MFSVSAELLHGTFRGDALGTANTGRLVVPEWPPTPFRLFAAFVAADGTGDRCTATDGSELEWIERLPPPVIHADCNPPHSEMQPRYVVKHQSTGKQKTHQEYVAREGALVRPSIRVAPKDPRLVYSWDVAPPSKRILDALRFRAARIGYLGTSDSPARVRVRTGDPPPIGRGVAYVPDSDGTLHINVPRPGDLSILDQMYQAWQREGASVSRSQFPGLRHEAAYRDPRSGRRPSGGSVVAWMSLDKAVSGRRIGVLTGLFKKAVLSHYQRKFGDPPAVLHGHGWSGKGYELARFLALPDVAFPHSRGRIHGLALWLPLESDAAERRSVRSAAYSVRRLVGNGIDVSVARRHMDRPLAVQPRRWEGESREWVTAFPAVHERHGTLDLDEVSRWCGHAGLPAPIAFRLSRTPLVRGAVDLAPVEVHRRGRPRLPYCHVALRFAEPVRGPVVIGSGRQRGLGLCAPLDSHSRTEEP